MFSQKAKVTKSLLKRVQNLKRELIQWVNSDTRSQLKSVDTPLESGETRDTLYPMLVHNVRVTPEVKAKWQKLIEHAEAEEKRILEALAR